MEGLFKGKPNYKHQWRLYAFLLWVIFFIISSCDISSHMPTPVSTPPPELFLTRQNERRLKRTPNFQFPPTSQGSLSRSTPTPDQPHSVPTIRTDDIHYIVQPGDTLSRIASQYHTHARKIQEANNLENPDLLAVGQAILVPPPAIVGPAPSNKIIPDSELVFGPYGIFFDTSEMINSNLPNYANYSEPVGDAELSLSEIIDRVAIENSVNPRLLIGIAGYVTNSGLSPFESTLALPNPPLKNAPVNLDLYRKFSWSANILNKGYYLWKLNAFPNWVLADGSSVIVSPTSNAGTAAIHYYLSFLYGKDEWFQAVGPNGISLYFQDHPTDPFFYSLEPWPSTSIEQPPLRLPFEPGVFWSFTGGPHAGWGDGSAWAALDFAPPGNALGCVQSDSWVTASGDGVIAYSQDGMVILDLDGDGYMQTGWVVFYLHIENRDRIENGVYVRSGDRIGHPSCEGGISSGTHVHIARRYNGEWISADQIPFNLDGWLSSGDGIEYNGFLTKNGHRIEAWNGRRKENQISQ